MERPVNFIEQQTEKIKSPTPRWLIFLIIIIVLLAGGCMTRVFFGEKPPNDPNAYDPVTLQPKKPEGFFNKVKQLIFTKDNDLKGSEDDRINILALGMGGVGHDGPYLTDTIMIVSIKPSTNQIALISVPRDLQVNIPGAGWRKINYANSLGETKNPGQGPELTKKVIEKTFDINIHYYVRVDFKAFSELINEVGGVTVDVERGFTDHMYPAPNEAYQTVSFTAGTQSMDGQTALIFARSRHGNNSEGSDFARAKRQQKIILALKEKILSFSTFVNPIRINNIINTLERNIATNLQFSEIMSFLKTIKELDTQAIIHLVLDNSDNGFLQDNTTPEGAYVLIPKTGNFDTINETIKNIFTTVSAIPDNTPKQTSIPLVPANIEIQNGTWIAGMAARMKKRLEDNDFTITTIGNSSERPQTLSSIYQISKNETKAMATALQEELRIPIKQTLPIGISPASSTDILIILGTDIQE